MKIIILAGGEGKRMWPIITDKCLISFLGKPLLYHNLKKIKENVEGEFVIVTASKNKEAVSTVAEELGLNYKVAIQKEPKGTAHALLACKDVVDDDFIMVNGDDLFSKEDVKKFTNSKSCAIAVAKHENAIEIPSRLVINENGDYFVLMQNGNSVVKKQVQVGISDNNGMIEIISGLAVGDHITNF